MDPDRRFGVQISGTHFFFYIYLFIFSCSSPPPPFYYERRLSSATATFTGVFFCLFRFRFVFHAVFFWFESTRFFYFKLNFIADVLCCWKSPRTSPAHERRLSTGRIAGKKNEGTAKKKINNEQKYDTEQPTNWSSKRFLRRFYRVMADFCFAQLALLGRSRRRGDKLKERRRFLSAVFFYRCIFLFTLSLSLSPPQHPYPSEDQKKQLAQDTGLTILQVNNW